MPRMMMHYGLEPSLRSYISRFQKDGRRFVEYKCSDWGDVEKDFEIIIYRTIVAILDKAQKDQVEMVSINTTSDPQIYIVVDVKYQSNYYDDFSIKNSSFEDYQKRIELLGGVLRIQKLDRNSLRITILFKQ